MTAIELNGQSVVHISELDLDKIKAYFSQIRLTEASQSDISRVFSYRQLSEHFEFYLGAFGVKPWLMPYLVYALGSKGKFRITIKNYICPNCGWRGKIGDALEPENFLGVPGNHQQEIFQSLKQVERKSCLSCGQQIPGAIWIEG